MIIIINRVSSRTFNWSKFGSSFVQGGLPVGAPPCRVATAYLHRGFNPRTAHDEPKHRRGPQEWNHKFTYRWVRPVRNLVQLTSAPIVLTQRDLRAARGRVTRRRRWRDYLRLDLIIDFGSRVIPALGPRRWFNFVHLWWNKLEHLRGQPSSSTAVDDEGYPVAGFRYVELFHRVQRQLRQRRWRHQGYYPRWYVAPRKNVTFDLLRSLLLWRANVQPTVLSLRGCFMISSEEVNLSFRLRQLGRRQRALADAAQQNSRYLQHVNFVFTRITQKVSTFRRRQIRWRRHQLQSTLSQRHQPKVWFNLVTRSFFRRFKASRHPWLETLRLTQPAENYAFGLYYRATRILNTRVGSVLEYTYLKKFGKYLAFVNRKTLRSRRWRLGDHPTHRVSLVESRNQRWGWFRQGKLTATTDTVLEVKRQTKQVETPLLDPKTPPLEPGMWAVTYWNLQEWGRGSRWRTKPLKRALSVFFKTVRSGHAHEYDMQQWGHAATSATGVKHGLIIEDEVDFRCLRFREIFRSSLTAERLPTPKLTWISLWASRIRWSWASIQLLILTGGWWLFLIVWFPYSWVAQLFSLFFSFVIWLIHRGCLWLTRPAVAVSVLWIEGNERMEEQWFLFWTHSPLFKVTRWVYLSWIMAYSSGDDGIETEIPSIQEDDRDNYFYEEDEQTGNYGHDDGDLGGHPLRDDPRFPWEFWWNKELDSFYDEGLEIAHEIIFEELPGAVRLATRPLVDLFIRLPLWGFLDGLTALVAAVKLDVQRGWYAVLTYGNTPTRVGGRWWKWPLVATRVITHWAVTVIMAFILSAQLSVPSLKLWIVYSLGINYQDEYYLLWLSLCWGGCIWLIGPGGIRGYLFEEIGLSNLLFLFVGTTSLTFPEEYYPHRAATPIRTEWLQRTNRFFHKAGYWEFTGSDRTKGVSLGLSYTDDFRVTLAQLRAYNEFLWEIDLDDAPSNTGVLIPHLDEYTLHYKHYKGDPLRLDLNLEKRHPTFTRSNFYNIHFVVNDDSGLMLFPSYHYSGPLRNRQTAYTRNQSEIASNLPPE